MSCTCDTGNTVTARSVITRDVHNKLSAGFSSIGGQKIGTAKAGNQLTRIGRSREIRMKVEGLQRTFRIRPVVTEGLSDELNLGNGFLSEIGNSVPCAIVYHKKSTKLKVGDEEVELIRTINNMVEGKTKNKLTGKVRRSNKQKSGDSARQTVQTAAETRKQPKVREPRSRKRSQRLGDRRQMEPERARKINVYCARTVELKKNTLNFIPTYLNGEKTKELGSVMVELNKENDDQVTAIYDFSNGKENRIAVLNTGGTTRKIKKGEKLGVATGVRILRQDKVEPGQEEEKTDIDEILRKLKIEENELLQENPEVKKELIRVI